jgi:hypothetical protein
MTDLHEVVQIPYSIHLMRESWSICKFDSLISARSASLWQKRKFSMKKFIAALGLWILTISPRSDAYQPHIGSRGQNLQRLRQTVKGESSFQTREDDIWTSRRKIIRSTLKPIVKRQVERKKTAMEKALNNADEDTANDDIEKKKKKPTGLLVSAFFIAVSATVLRLGGRTAFVQMLGLDFVTGSGIKTQVNDFVGYFQSLGDVSQLAAFFFAWLAAKALCIDAATIVLALSSGVLFGGIFEGTAVSVICSSTASLCVFFLSRSQLLLNKFFRKQEQKIILILYVFFTDTFCEKKVKLK